MDVQQVDLLLIDNGQKGELSEQVYYECDFCGKTVEIKSGCGDLHERLSPDGFHCSFCLRNGFHTKHSKNILAMSFRGIIGWYYYDLYLASRAMSISVSEIQDCIDSHAKTGLQNPVFFYDDESYLWFIDFGKVGKGRKKVRLDEVLKTVVNILSCFNLYERLTAIRIPAMYQKYEEAVTKFYSQRSRPTDKRLCIPTLYGCGMTETHKKFSWEDTRQFVPASLTLI